MKLELKHLAPYLPYGLNVQIQGQEHLDKKLYLNGLVDVNSTEQIWCEVDYNDDSIIESTTLIEDLSPILRPLSDLTKEIELFNDYVVFIPPTNYEDCKHHSYEIIERLFEHHFDVFGLIKEGLAIDINTL